MLHSVYLPFPEENLRRHFADVKWIGGCKGTADGHIVYDENSILFDINGFCLERERG